MTAACPKFWVAVSLLVAITPAARAGPLSWLDAISGAAEREGANALRTAAKLGRDLGKEEKRAILESGDRGTFRLTNPDDGNLIATFEPDTVSSLGLTGYVVVIPEQLLNTQPEVVRRLLKEPGLKSAVAADDRLWPLRLESIPGQEALLVEASENLGLTTKAFEHRAVLERISSGPLVRRMRVVPMISRADPVAAAAFREGVPQASTLPADRTDALGLIGRNREKLLVITGHVEGEAFVVRSLSGEEEFRVPINEIYREADRVHSEVLLLGCGVACATNHTGPLQNITADAVIRALSAVDPAGNALTFLKQLSDHTGPLLIQDDHRGGFLIVDDADSRRRNLKWAAASSPVRLVIQNPETNASAIFVESKSEDTGRNPIYIFAAVAVACALAPFVGGCY